VANEIEAATMCFACGPENPIGLRIHFHFDGGIIYTALDDVTANVLYQQGRKAHTARCEVRYRQIAKVDDPLKLKGWIESERRRLVSERRRLVILRGEVRRATDDVLVADCVSTFMLEQLQ
jgi:acyl-coenzyme A thioesterase PaaI-like protein